MIKNFLVSIALLFSVSLLAQTGTPSPYSFYGVGDMTFKGSLENRSMGGVSVFADSIHLNLQNPASVAGLKLTTFTVGLTYGTTNFMTNTSEDKATRVPFDYIAVGFPMGKFGASFGLMPYTSVGYKMRSMSVVGTDTLVNSATGTGGLSRGFVALGYKITPKLNIGLDVNYNFGEVTTSNIVGTANVQYGTRELSTSEMTGLSLNAGLMYQSKLNKKYDVFGSLVLSPESKIKSVNSRNIATVTSSEDTGESEEEPIDVAVANTTMRLPAKISFGGGIGQARKWLVGTEITFRKSDNMGSRFTDIGNVAYENSQRYSIGGYYIPNYASFRSYLSRVTYRGGLRYETTGLVIAGKTIEDKAVTFGLSLPMGGSISNVNIGVEMGRRGTKAAGLVQENYTNFSISLSLNDKWFTKRKYN